VSWWGTTICCSALALTAAFPPPAAAQTSAVPVLPARPQWTLALNNALVAPPGFFEARGYFPIEDNRIAAYDLADGRLAWLVPRRTLFQPVATDRHLFVVEPDAIVALAAADGSESWRLPIGEPLATRPVSRNGWLVAATASGTLIVVRAADGHVVWQRDNGARISAPPSVASDRIYVPLENRRIVALALEDGAMVWDRGLGGSPTSVLATDDRVYVGATDNFLYAFRTASGGLAWRWRTGADIIGTPVVEDDRLYFLSLDNILRALDREGGSQKWKRPLPFRPRNGLLYVSGTLVVGGLSPSVRGYAEKTGAPAGDLTLPGELVAPPHVFTDAGLPVLVAVTTDIVKGAIVGGYIPAAGLPGPFTPLPNQPAVPALTLP
jgi:outer membrane protein assembly factor BamB